MSGILKFYFKEKKYQNHNNNLLNSLTSRNNTKILYNSGLHLLDNNILSINKNIRNSTVDSRMKIMKDYNLTEPNNYDLNSEELKLSKNSNRNENKNLKLIISRNEKILKDKEKNLTLQFNQNDNSKELEKIMDSLISTNNKVKKTNLHHAELISLKKNKEKYPIEKSISPSFYIDYNFREEPDNRKLFLSFNTQLKCLNNKVEFRKKILRQIETNNSNRLKIDDLKNIHNNEFYTELNNKKIENIFKINRNSDKKNLHFNLYDYYNNIHKMKVNNRNKYNNKKFEKIKNHTKENKILMTFENKLKNAENSTIKTVKHLDSLSRKNNKILKKIINKK